MNAKIRFGRSGPRLGNIAGKGFLLVFLAWAAVCLLGALPYYCSGHIPAFVDAVFESVSGFTTTGASVLHDIEAMPRPLLFWRALTHWLGGMGIVVLTVALLPLLGASSSNGAGGFQLVKAEAPGPEMEKLTPRITLTARILWLLYIALTALAALLFICFGMDWFDAVTHSFSTMATGGFSSRNNSLAHYNSPALEWICTVFMLLAGFNFSLIWQFLRGKYRDLLRNSEAKAYGAVTLIAGLVITITVFPQSASLEAALRQAFFNVASILTTTGLYNEDYNLWPALAQGTLFLLMFLGGCSGSTSGGVKIIRYVILAKQTGNEMKKIAYPRGVFNIRLDGKSGKKEVVYGVAGFVFLYFLLIFLTALLVSSAGEDIFTSLNTALICLGNIGLGLGKLGPFQAFPDFPGYVKWGLSFVMIAGRLELWTVMVFFTRDFWRR
ncbi:MAG: TrkH family potassium uptake protein [Treponema sp.]|jgi:trk system potassium uptake protein TrkH|nr:TrkH family potassium uptake protein [Treponema sp.]